MTTVSNASVKDYHQKQVSQIWPEILRIFSRWVHFSIMFNVSFVLLASSEVALFLSFFALMSQSTILAFTLAIFFLTLFAYFVLHLFFQSRRPEQIEKICEEYLQRCKTLMHYQDGIPEHHIALANAANKFAALLYEKEYTFFVPPVFLKPLASTLEKFSCFCYWKDLHKLKELLLTTSIEEHIKVVQCEPTNLEVHAALANAYVMLSSLYADPRKYHDYDDERWIHPERYSEQMQEKFRITAQRAIEEFKILNEYAPDDPWVHVQLAYSYHDLQMPQEEIREYEIVIKLRPDDKDTLFKLGMLYFQQGMNAQGLHIYKTLKQTNYKKAANLIKFYGSLN